MRPVRFFSAYSSFGCTAADLPDSEPVEPELVVTTTLVPTATHLLQFMHTLLLVAIFEPATPTPIPASVSQPVAELTPTIEGASFPGGILYSHITPSEIAETIDRFIDRFIGELQSQGYTFVPMSVIMSSDPQSYLIPNN